MNNKSVLISLAIFLTLGIFATLTQTFAQGEVPQNPDTYQAPTGGAITDQTNDTTGVTRAENVFNPLWLLPIIAVPLLIYLLLLKRRDRESSENRYEPEFAGAKGGRAEDESDEIIETDRSRFRDEDL